MSKELEELEAFKAMIVEADDAFEKQDAERMAVSIKKTSQGMFYSEHPYKKEQYECYDAFTARWKDLIGLAVKHMRATALTPGMVDTPLSRVEILELMLEDYNQQQKEKECLKN